MRRRDQWPVAGRRMPLTGRTLRGVAVVCAIPPSLLARYMPRDVLRSSGDDIADPKDRQARGRGCMVHGMD